MSEQPPQHVPGAERPGDDVPGPGVTRRPRFYRTLAEQQPALVAALDALGEAARRAGPLDARTLHLVQLAAAAAMRSEGGVHSHVRRGLAEGLSPAELRHAVVGLTSTIGFPNMVAALTWVEDEIGRAPS